jgi:hypothetical protein
LPGILLGAEILLTCLPMGIYEIQVLQQMLYMVSYPYIFFEDIKKTLTSLSKKGESTSSPIQHFQPPPVVLEMLVSQRKGGNSWIYKILKKTFSRCDLRGKRTRTELVSSTSRARETTGPAALRKWWSGVSAEHWECLRRRNPIDFTKKKTLTSEQQTTILGSV